MGFGIETRIVKGCRQKVTGIMKTGIKRRNTRPKNDADTSFATETNKRRTKDTRKGFLIQNFKKVGKAFVKFNSLKKSFEKKEKERRRDLEEAAGVVRELSKKFAWWRLW